MRWDIPCFKTMVPGQLQYVAADILQRALARLPCPVDLHVYGDYQFNLFSTLR